jgi:hypothetical protein
MLFGDAGAFVVRSRTPMAATTLADLAALPSREHPRVLVPARSRRSAAAALRQFNQGMTGAARARKLLASTATLAGAARLEKRRLIVTASPGPHDGASLRDALAAAIDVPEVRIAVFIGSARPNRKPVLQLTAPDGRVVGYAKVAWSDLTRRLIANEADALRSLEGSPVPGLGTPIVRAEIAWRGLRVLITSAGAHPWWRRGAVGLRPSPEVVAAVGAVEPPVRAPLAHLPFSTRLRSRIRPLPPELRQIADDALDGIVNNGAERRVLAGRWHGDWSPWNMHRTRRGWFVWDWERSETGVPVGLDTVHHAFLWTLHLTGWSGDAAAQAALRAASEALPVIGQPPGLERALVGLSMLELLLRFQEGQAAGMPVDERWTAALIEVLSRWPEARQRWRSR